MRRTNIDPLYSVFEQHLFTALVHDESTEDFLTRVVTEFIARLLTNGTMIPQSVRTSMESDLKDEVLEMLRKKTYGHYCLNSFRRANGIEISAPLHDALPFQNEKARPLKSRAS